MKNTLEENLELRKALAEVDRLTAENVRLKNENNELEFVLEDEARAFNDKFRRLRLSIINQIVLFQMGTQSPHESAKIIKQILES